mgnify:CR=1 FL=1
MDDIFATPVDYFREGMEMGAGLGSIVSLVNAYWQMKDDREKIQKALESGKKEKIGDASYIEVDGNYISEGVARRILGITSPTEYFKFRNAFTISPDVFQSQKNLFEKRESYFKKRNEILKKVISDPKFAPENIMQFVLGLQIADQSLDADMLETFLALLKRQPRTSGSGGNIVIKLPEEKKKEQPQLKPPETPPQQQIPEGGYTPISPQTPQEWLLFILSQLGQSQLPQTPQTPPMSELPPMSILPQFSQSPTQGQIFPLFLEGGKK